jgi:hypothetical protein
MKATIEVPDELYRQVKAKSALEGRAVREVAEELFRRYISDEPQGAAREKVAQPLSQLLAGEPVPTWFGALEKYARRVKRKDMDAIRESIAAGIARERDL